MSALVIHIAAYRKAPGCPRCGAVDHQVELAGWRWGTCRAHRLKWKIGTATTYTSATGTDSAIKVLGDYWPADRHGGGPDAA